MFQPPKQQQSNQGAPQNPPASQPSADLSCLKPAPAQAVSRALQDGGFKIEVITKSGASPASPPFVAVFFGESHTRNKADQLALAKEVIKQFPLFMFENFPIDKFFGGRIWYADLEQKRLDASEDGDL